MTSQTESRAPAANHQPAPVSIGGRIDHRQLVAAIPSILIAVDSQLKVTEWNGTAAATFGLTADAVLDRPLFAGTIPWDEAPLRDGLDTCRTEGRVVRLDDVPFVRPGGEPALLGASINPMACCGGPGFLILAADITERAAARELLRDTEAHFRRILDSCPAIVYTTKADNGYPCTYVNGRLQELMGYRPEEMIADTDFWYSRVHPDDRTQASQGFTEHLERGAVELEYRFRHCDGSYRWIHDRHELIRDKQGRPLEIIGSWTDITERREAETRNKHMEVQLRQAQKLEAIGQLAAGIAHEINTPTQFVADNVHFMKDAFADLARLVEAQTQFIDKHASAASDEGALAELKTLAEELDVDYLREEIPTAIDQTLEGTRRIAEIVRAMKEFSHPGTSQKSPIDINQAIANTLTVARNEWKYVADVRQEFDTGLPQIPCLPGELNQAILNLVVNAAHAIRDAVDGEQQKGTITIATGREDDWLKIAVSDTGCGIPAELKERIFEPFFTTKEVGKGTGQGLAIVHSVVIDKHGGRLCVDSAPGEGTTMTMWLPINDPHADAA